MLTNIHNAYCFINNQRLPSICEANNFSVLDEYGMVFDYLHEQYQLSENFKKYVQSIDQWREQTCRTFWVGNSSIDNSQSRSKLKKALQTFLKRDSIPDDWNDVGPFYRDRINIEGSFDSYEGIKEQIASEGCSLVSFDVFDTLIVRPFFVPSDLFMLLDVRFTEVSGCSSLIQFSSIRKKSEDVLRVSRVGHEVTLDEIYDKMVSDYGLDMAVLEIMKKEEIALEMEFSHVRKSG